MSLLIKSMKMPKSCWDCPFLYDFLYCSIRHCIKERYENEDKRDKNCPLVEVPEPHGRLIDADKLMDDVKKNSASYFADDFAREWVDAQPTVIEAKGE